ncbi:MAG: LamG domain-containing protein [Parcubacteria group bacterium]|jgi:post-segregation antitoxin (ccd killing protein)
MSKFQKLLLILVFTIIGLSSATFASAASNVYYSVGQSTADLKNGTPNVSITSGVATLSVAQTGNIGVGDVIVANAISYYISSRSSQSVWNVVTNTGATPTNITSTAVTSIKHVYPSLSAAVTGASTLLGSSNLTTADVVLNILCYYDSGADTTAVTVSGYTTDATRYIKIYTPSNTSTEANNSQRHSGKWDASKYRLEVSAATALSNSNLYTVIEGLQIYETPNAHDQSAIYSTTSSTIKGNICKGDATNSTYRQHGINILSTNGNTIYIENNVVYNFSRIYSSGILMNSGYPIFYALNNTVYNNYNGIYNSGVDTAKYIKNNISMGSSGFNFAGTFDSNASNNVSYDATAPGTGSLTNQSLAQVAFISTVSGNEDFHLQPSSVAKNIGVDLSSYFTTDIDGATRNTAINAWDIGADEAATQIFRSVGPSATAVLESDTSHARTVTLTSGVATFSAALADNIGVGDAVLIDTGGTDQTIDASDTILFISSRNSATSYTLQANNGSVPSDIAVNDTYSIYRAYTSLSLAEAGTKNTSIPITFNGGNRDLATNNEQWNLACYANGTTADTTAARIDSWTTDTTRFIKIYTPVTTAEVGISQRHSGKWDTSKYRLETGTGASSLRVTQNYTVVQGLQVYNSSTVNEENGISLDAYRNHMTARDNIVKGGYTGISTGSQSSSDGNNYIINNIVYGAYRTGINANNPVSTNPNFVYNNSVSGCNVGVVEYGYGITASAEGIVENNISINLGGYGTYKKDFAATIQSYNISQDTSATGTGSLTGKTNTDVKFVSIISGAEELHLQAGSVAKNVGADLSGTFTTDIDGQTRSASLGWDIGADEAANAVYYSVGQSTANLMTGTPNVAITAGVATFDVAQTGNIGVGDVIVANAISYYIASKTSTTVWNVVTVTGATPTDITSTAVTSIKHVYTSLNSAAAGAGTLLGTTDLYTNNYQINIPCYYDSAADTTAVTISGYTTAMPNYIKIYTPNNTTTESNNLQRHSGKWDDGKYKLSLPGTLSGITINIGYIKIDGIQLKYTNSTVTARRGISVNGEKGTSVWISNCILQGVISGAITNVEGVMFEYSTTGNRTAYFWNNIIYGFINDSNDIYGIYSRAPWKVYAYNNTLYNNYKGLYAEVSNLVLAKNNTVYNNTSYDYSGTFDASSTNNISKDATSPNAGATDCGGHSCRSQTVAFISTTSGAEDFHLASTDTAARNSGADLSTDANLLVATDIDGNARPASAGFDIGADEAAAQIFYSVGQNTTDHKTGSPTVTVSGTTATFSVAQTATNMGVGDLVTYTGGTCYISAKTSTTVWSCLSVTGGAPTAATNASVTSIAHAFASLEGTVDAGTASGAFDATHLNTKDLVAGNYQLNVPCYYDSGADTTAVTVQSWTTGFYNYLRIYTPVSTTSEVNQSQRHGGKWDDGKYSLQPPLGTNTVLNLSTSNVDIDGIQIKHSKSDGSGATTIKTYYGEIKNNIIVEVGTSVGYAIGNWRANTLIYNNIIYGISGSPRVGISAQNGQLFYAYNNTIYGLSVGLGISWGHIIAKNNVAYNNVTDYSGTFEVSSTNNLSKDGTAPPFNTYYTNKTLAFTNVTSGAEDFHLVTTDTDSINKGADLSADTSLSFTTDIDGAPRNAAINAWDIGADETATQIFRSVAPSATAVLESDTSHARTVTLTSGVATFSNALSDTIGVGDAVLIDTGGTDQTIDASDTILFISSRNSATSYTLQANNGSVPSDIAINDTYSIYRAYTSLSLAEAGTKNASIPMTFNGGDRNLFTNNEQWNIAAYANGTTADTTAVAVSGWTTAQQDFIKVYTPVSTTEVGTSQRHAGKWDSGKYRLEVDATYVTILDSIDNNVVIDGLQIKFIATNYSQAGLRIRGKNNYISNNIIQGAISGSASNNYAIYPYYVSNPSNMYIWNNIVYGFNSSGGAGISLAYTNNIYLYNNTLYGNASGIKVPISSSAIAKNNIAYNNGTDYVTSGTGYFNSASTNNLSKDATAPAYNTYYVNKTLDFIDTANKDFHLSQTDTAARGVGANLSDDAAFSVETRLIASLRQDIDGQMRNPAGAGWDIGADEGTVEFAPTVMQTGGDYSSLNSWNVGVASNLTAATTRVFAHGGKTGTIADNASVTGLTSNATATVVHASATQILLENISGTFQTGETVQVTAGNSVVIADNGNPASAVAKIDGAWTSADTTAVTINGFTTGADDYVRIYTTPIARHQGKWDDGKYRLEISNANIIYSYMSYVRIDGLQIEATRDGSTAIGIRLSTSAGAGDFNVSGCIFKGINNSTGTHYGLYITNSLVNLYIWNNIIYGFQSIGMFLNASNAFVYNNSVNNNVTGIYRNNGRVVSKNNISYSNTTKDYDGSFDASSTNNLSSDATSPNSGATDCGGHSCRNQTVAFISTTSGSEDFHLSSSDTAAKDSGIDLSGDANLRFTTDIDVASRQANKWDIGADEFWEAQTGGSVGGASAITTPAVADYDFNEGFGSLAHNAGSGGATLNGTLNAGGIGTNPTTTAMWDKGGKFGGAIEFDGTDDYVSATQNGTALTQLSVSFWLKSNSTPTSDKGVFQWVNILSAPNPFIAISRTANTNNYRFFIDGNDRVTTAMVNNSWYFVSLVLNSSNLWTVYINGTSVGTYQDDATHAYQASANSVYFGNDFFGYLDGLMDDAKIFNYALSDSQIKTLYNNNSALSAGNDASRNNNGTTVTGTAKDYCIPGDTAQCDKPVGEWKMDEKVAGDAKTIYDTSGNGNDGTTHWGANASGMDCSVPGKFGSGCGFDGVDDYVSVANNSVLDIADNGNFSFGGWFKISSNTGDAEQPIISKRNSNTGPNYQGYELFIKSDNTIDCLIQQNGSNSSDIWSTTTYNDGKWHYAECVLTSGVSNKLFVDGINVASDVTSIPSTGFSNSQPLTFGISSNYSPWNFSGSIDQVQIFNYARTPAQIAWDFNKGGPIAEWRLNECTGATVHDETTNGNNGTINLGTSGTQTTAIGNGTCSASASTPWYNGRTGKYNASLNFDGTDDYVSANSTISSGTAGSTVVWIKPSGSYTNSQCPVGGIGAGGASYQSRYLICAIYNAVCGDSSWSAWIGNGTTYQYACSTQVYNSTNFPAGVWTQLIATYDGTNIKLYKDGILVKTVAQTVSGAGDAQPFSIGRLGGYNGGRFNGQIDNVKIFNYALTPLQVQAEYNNGASVGF